MTKTEVVFDDDDCMHINSHKIEMQSGDGGSIYFFVGNKEFSDLKDAVKYCMEDIPEGATNWDIDYEKFLKCTDDGWYTWQEKEWVRIPYQMEVDGSMIRPLSAYKHKD